MSAELKKALLDQAERDYERERREIMERLAAYQELLARMAAMGGYTLPLWAEGGDAGFDAELRDLSLLERAGLIKGAYGFTEHNMFRKYSLTERGKEIARKLQVTEKS